MTSSLEEMLTAAGIDGDELTDLVKVALDEDLRYGPDVTSDATTRPDQEANAVVAARQAGIICGVPVALAVLRAVDYPLAGVTIRHGDGDSIDDGDVVLQLTGPLQPLLLAERTMLNFVTHLSGVATATGRWVRAVSGTKCRIRDTRKTTPGHRQLEKYAVRIGGATNHRMGLGDAALIKDNHIVAAGGVARAVMAVRARSPEMSVEVECDTIDQVREALDAECSLILLDNMDTKTIVEAVAVIRRQPGVCIEISGGLTLEEAPLAARSGVDFLAVGAITHSVVALDLGLDIVEYPS